MTRPLDEHFFRHEFGRLVAMISRRVGTHHLEAVEDAVQSALLAAVESWPRGGVPDNPSAWLHRVAYNRFIDGWRRREPPAIEPASPDLPAAVLAGDVTDDLLRMLFACCDGDLPVESQLVLALKVLCGFGVREIATRLFTGEANVYKRLGRARARLREAPFVPDELSVDELTSRLPAVQAVLYTLFAEGHLSVHGDAAIRRELCDEARRLTLLLAEHPAGAEPSTFALLAAMCFHLARMPARQDASGGLLLLEEQDRTRWSSDEIRRGFFWLARSAEGDAFTRYHAEAGVAAEHCRAATFAETRWDRIVACYELLERLAPSPLHRLNRVVALAEWRGPTEALAVLDGQAPPSWLAGSYLWSAVLADLHRRSGHDELARSLRDTALASAPSDAVRTVLARRLA